MLIPRRVKHRKQHHPKRTGAAKGGTKVTFGEWGLQALEPAYVTNRQIESARIAITRRVKRGGKVWINIYPDRPLTKKPAETEEEEEDYKGLQRITKENQTATDLFVPCKAV